MSDLDNHCPLRGFFAIWIYNYDPPCGPMELSPRFAKGYDGWAVSNKRYCARHNLKTIRRFTTWNEVVIYMDSKNGKSEIKFKPVYIVEVKNGSSTHMINRYEDAVSLDHLALEREIADRKVSELMQKLGIKSER